MNNYIFILTYFIGGGTEKVFENIAKALYKNDSKSKIMLFVINGFDEKKYSIENYIHLIKNRRDLLSICKKNTDVCVVNFSGDWKSSLLAFRLSKNFISWIHCNPYTMRNARTGIFNFYLLKKSAKIVCVCNEQKEILMGEFKFKNNISVIYNSVDFEFVNEKAIEKLDFDSKFFLMVARMDFKSKDFFTVIDAYSQLSQNIRNEYKLVFLGDGADKEKISDYISKKQLENRIFLAGFDQNPYKWFKNAVCNILSSRTEGFSVSIIEGMALGCPEVITNYRTGAKEVADDGKNALIVPIGDSISMKNAMQNIVENDEIRNSMIENSNHFIRNFSQDAFEMKIINFFNAWSKN